MEKFASQLICATKPIDEDNIEIAFVASPDSGVSLEALRNAFEAVLAETAGRGIPGETYATVRKRFSDFWPDWENEEKAAAWMDLAVMATVFASPSCFATQAAEVSSRKPALLL